MTAKHPARFSPQILDVLRVELAGAPWVHDPFAGTGERLGALCDELRLPFSGTEIEAPYIVSLYVVQDDSRNPATYPPAWKVPRWWIVTSPVYPNGMADNFRSSGICSECVGWGGKIAAEERAPWNWIECSKCGGSGRRAVNRHTYRQAAIELSGDPDYRLHEANMGAQSYRGGRKAAERYWTLAEECVACWGSAERAIVNVKDFWMGGELIALGRRWIDLMKRHGWTIDHEVRVPCPGQRNGANRERRVECEDVLVFVRA